MGEEAQRSMDAFQDKVLAMADLSDQAKAHDHARTDTKQRHSTLGRDVYLASQFLNSLTGIRFSKHATPENPVGVMRIGKEVHPFDLHGSQDQVTDQLWGMIRQ